MKSRFRKALAVLLAVTLACCMSMPVFAAAVPESGRIIITGTYDQLAGQEINVIRILDIEEPYVEDANANGLIDEEEGDPNYSMNISWLPLVVENLISDLGLPIDLGGLNVLDLSPLSIEIDDLLMGSDGLDLNINDILHLKGMGYLDLIGALVGDLGIVLDLLLGLVSNPLAIPNVIDGVVDGVGAVTTGLVSFLGDLLGEPNSVNMMKFAEAMREYVRGGEDGTTILSSLLGMIETYTVLPAPTLALGTVGQENAIPGGDNTWANLGADVRVTFNNLPTGMYLVDFPISTDLDPILVNVPSFAAENIKPKNDEPTVDKMVKIEGEAAFADNDSAFIGDAVDFQVDAYIPNWFTGYTVFNYQIKDTFTKGLTITNPPTNLVVELFYGSEAKAVADVTIPVDADAPDTGYALGWDATNAATTGTVMTFDFGDLVTNTAFVDDAAAGADTIVKDAITAAGGAYLRITYQGTLNENAVAGIAGNKNTVQAYYSDAFDGDNYDKPSFPDTSGVYTYDIDIDKFDWDTEVRLNGAKFVLSKSENETFAYTSDTVIGTAGEAIVLFQEDTALPTYRVATGETGETIGDTDVGYVATTNTNVGTIDGEALITGLKEGTYYLYEVVAPAGGYEIYENDPAIIVIEPTAGNYEALPTYSTFGPWQDDAEPPVVKTNNIISFGNGDYIPAMGGAGTVGLTILGVVIIAGGVIFTSRSRKSRKNHQ